ncbi:hypothetical protein NPIL_495771 [Nephila pilipes]|uniref:Uncharacterized protein n=1 Tax=Nephila pilipes TaxID=299642 RepID=A0A8X6PUE9_NEPPI|nr:hypothetical protein NPIL_495771 [Nephila pilipes]
MKELQDLTKLIGTRLRIYPASCHQIRGFIDNKKLQHHTYQLPEDKMIRAVIRGMPTDMSPSDITRDLEELNILAEECYNRALRIITKAPIFIPHRIRYDKLHIHSIPRFICKQAHRFHASVNSHSNSTISQQSNIPTISSINKCSFKVMQCPSLFLDCLHHYVDLLIRSYVDPPFPS